MATMVLGDDHVVFLDALSAVLTQHGHSVGAVAPTAAELVSAVRNLQPDVCMINRYLEVDDLADVIGLVTADSPGTRVIVLSSAPDTAAAMRALDAGAAGYVHKSRGVSALISAVERVLRGTAVIDVPAGAGTRSAASANDPERLAARLTIRERECLSLLVEGLDTAAMVVKLGISRTTVRTHVQAVLSKLGVHSRLEAASFAVRSGILGTRPDDLPARRWRAHEQAARELEGGCPPARSLPRGRRRMAAGPAADQGEPLGAGVAALARPPSARLPERPSADPFPVADRAG